MVRDDSRRVILVRHAKTEQAGPSDRERALASRGRADARAIGELLAEQGIEPDRIVVSPALRAQQTWQIAADGRGWSQPVTDERIYDNAVDSLLEVIRETAPDVRTLVLVGHNPSMGMLAGEPHFPTSAVAVLACAGSWKQIDPAAMTGVRVDVPRGR